MYNVTVQVDTNDADYYQDTTNLGQREFTKLMTIINKIKPLYKNPQNPRIEDYDETDFRKYFGTVLDESELELLLELIPVPEPGYAELTDISYTTGSSVTLLSEYEKPLPR